MDIEVDPMLRFTATCNRKFISNNTEAVDHYFQGLSDRLDRSRCLTDSCKEYEYLDLGMGYEGVRGIYPYANSYGTMGYSMDFSGADHAETRRKISMLKGVNWIDQFTRAVAVKWTVLNQWDGQFNSLTLVCESPGLQIKHCSLNLETVAFPERSFEASLDKEGMIAVNDGVTNDTTFTALLVVGIMMVTNIVHFTKIALEMNLGLSVMLNSIDFFHITVIELALLFYLYSTINKRSYPIDLTDT